MQRPIRTVAVRAALAMVVSLAAGSALAQSTDDAAPGKPLSLLQMLIHHGTASKSEAHARSKTAPKSSPRVAARTRKAETRTAERATHRRTHFAARHQEPARGTEQEIAATTAAPTPAAPWPLGQMAAPAAAANEPVATNVPTDPAPAAADPQVSELVVGGRTVEITSPEQVNALDLAADQQAAAQPATTAAAGDAVVATAGAPATAQGEAAVDSDAAASDATDDADAPAKPTQVVAFARQADDDTNHRPSWLAELLATLGGAIAAGSVAWFLIGSAPQRRFG